jgi:NAD(P)-dependent dehydrogenase (short-subunit alcohol dehydrogenase family)
MARALAGAGASVVVLARRAAALDETVAELCAAGAQAHGVSADLSDPDAIGRAANEVSGAFGEPDILVNAAGVNPRPPMARLRAQDWNLCMAVNLTAPFLLGQLFGPRMAERGWGRIINVASQQSFRAFGNSGAYGASKGGLVSLTRSQAEAWSQSGVCCNAIVPGFVATPMTAPVASDPARWAALTARTMVGRDGKPEDFEGAVVFLASGASDYVTGQAVFVDGGFSAT